MSQYETHIRKEVATFVSKLHKEFAGQYDYIEGPDSQLSLGLDHIEEYDAAEYNETPFEISIGIPGIDLMSKPEFQVLDESVSDFADEEGITVESTGGNGDYVEYTFYLHAALLDVPA